MGPALPETVSVLVGPTCNECASDDGYRRAPLSGALPGKCRDCSTEYRWYQLPIDGAAPGGANEAICRFCGVLYDVDHNDIAFCEDCELSDCAFCGISINRPLLSENLACQVCEGVAA
jgi:hypothetical protein